MKANKVFALCLMISMIALMLLCLITRLCGVLWFSANISSIPTPSKFWQEVIKGILLVFELLFSYKILCRTSWSVCLCTSLFVTAVGILLGELVNNVIVSNVYYMACIIILPIFFVRHWFSLIDNVVLYALSMVYGIVFLVGRIGGVENDSAYNFANNVLGTIDYKLFIVSLYLLVKCFGGIKLWKTQKRLIFQVDLPKKTHAKE